MAAETATETRTGPDDDTELGVDPGILSALGYIFNVVGALLLLVLEDNEYVRHHAAQSLLFTAAAVVASFVAGFLAAVLGLVPVVGGLFELLLGPGLRVGIAASFLFLAYKGYQGERYELPVLGAYVDDVEGIF